VRRLDTRSGERMQSIQIAHLSGSDAPQFPGMNREAGKKFPDMCASRQKRSANRASHL
jgi:hypothetical protein